MSLLAHCVFEIDDQVSVLGSLVSCVIFRSFNVNHNRRRYTNNNNKKVISVGGHFLPKFFRLFTFSRQELKN